MCCYRRTVLTAGLMLSSVSVAQWRHSSQDGSCICIFRLLGQPEKETGPQELVTDVAEISAKMGMCTNTAKTETQVLGKGDSKLQIQVYGQQLTQVAKFVYLGGSISTNGTEENVTRKV